MGLKPVDSLVYLYFKCPKCNEIGDEVRLREAKKNSTYYCPFCGHAEPIEPVKSLKLVYSSGKVEQSQLGDRRTLNPGRWIWDQGDIEVVKRSLQSVGYTSSEAREAVGRALLNHSPKTNDELFKFAVMEHERI